MSNFAPGSYVWYLRKNALVKILEFDRQSNSYTIEYKGRVIDTIERFLDPNIGFYYNKEKENTEKRFATLETYILELKKINEQLKEKCEKKSQTISKDNNIVCTKCRGTGIGEYSREERKTKACTTCNGTGVISFISNKNAFDVYNEGHPENALGDAFSYKGVVLGDGSRLSTPYRK